jgi:hypothetical protein
VQSERLAKNAAAGIRAQILKGVHSTERDVGIEDAQVAGHCESHESLTAHANADAQLRSRDGDDGSANMHSQKVPGPQNPAKRVGAAMQGLHLGRSSVQAR